MKKDDWRHTIGTQDNWRQLKRNLRQIENFRKLKKNTIQLETTQEEFKTIWDNLRGNQGKIRGTQNNWR